MKNKSFGILGLGLSGSSTLKFMLENNLNFIFWDDSTDQVKKNVHPNIKNNLANADDPRWQNVDYVIKSPGIPLNKPNKILDIAKISNIKIITDIELFYLLNPESVFIGITGTNGKSTTTTLIGNILKEAQLNVYVGGNIGKPAFELPQYNSPDHFYVLELSSYQLASLNKMRLNIGVILNITPDHLEWHGEMEQYIDAKFRIVKNSQESDLFIVNDDKRYISKYLTTHSIRADIKKFSNNESSDNYYISNNKIYKNCSHILDLVNNPYLQGSHNMENVIASYIAAKHLRITDKIFLKGMKTFVGLKHRFQPVKTINDISFINDSKATNLESAEKSIMATTKPTILIMGGQLKHGSMFENISGWKNKIRKVFLIGEAADQLSQMFKEIGIQYETTTNLSNAFEKSVSLSKTLHDQQAVLLAPGCASFDQWKNFEERGDYFIRLVEDYENEQL